MCLFCKIVQKEVPAKVLFENDEEEEQIEQFREFLDQVRPEDFAQGGGSTGG